MTDSLSNLPTGIDIAALEGVAPLPKRSPGYAYRIALVASSGGFLFGYDLIIIAGALPFLKQEFALSPTMVGFAVSSAILGAVVGPLLALWFTERIGRKWTMMLSALVFMASTIGCAFATSIDQFALWRFVGGMGIGLAMISSPIYIAELSPPGIRGSLVNVNQLSNVIGINLAVIVGYLFASNNLGWRWMLGSQAVPVLCLFLGLFLIPESPRWLASKGRFDEALGTLARINGEAEARRELDLVREDLSREVGGFRELLAPGTRTALVVGIALMVFSQANGVNMLLLYAPTIMMDAGMKVQSDTIISSIPVYLLILVCTLLAFVFIRRFSRRGLLIASSIGMAAGHILMALALFFKAAPLFLLVPMMIGTGAFTIGLAPLSWIIVSEIFPNRVRGSALAIVCLFLFASSFITAQFFPVLVEWFTIETGSSAGVYGLFALICLACTLFAWKILPETKGLSLEQIGQFWKDRAARRG